MQYCEGMHVFVPHAKGPSAGASLDPRASVAAASVAASFVAPASAPASFEASASPAS
jgi:hypothetical protein